MLRRTTQILSALVVVYIAVSSYGELRLLRLVESASTSQSDPRTYEGLSFPNAEQMSIYIEDGRRATYYPWTEPLPEWLVFSLLGAALGYLGGVARAIRSTFRSGRATRRPYALMGTVTALVLLGVSVLYPKILVEGDLHLRPAAAAAICLLGGVFSDEAWTSLRTLARTVFPKE